MRIVAFVLVVWFTTVPLAEAYAFGGASEPCPMAASMPDGSPCVTAPCPCDHSSPSAVAPQVAPGTLPAIGSCATPVAAAHPCVSAAVAAPASGFPFAIDHPPGRHA